MASDPIGEYSDAGDRALSMIQDAPEAPAGERAWLSAMTAGVMISSLNPSAS